MKGRSATGLWLPASLLVITVLWLGCEQKGEISPTGSSRQTLTFIDTVIVDPQILGPGEQATVEARVLNEQNEPAASEDVRFSVNRGTLAASRADTTVKTDSQGRARTLYTAPADTGGVLLRTELPTMNELRTTTMSVRQGVSSAEGLLTVWAATDTMYADNGTSSTLIFARLRNDQRNPIGDATIYFSTTLGSVTSPASTDPLSGIATATLVSSLETGLAIVIARYNDKSDTARIEFLEPAAASMIVVTSSLAQMSAGADTALITARVYDSNMQPVIDHTVVFFATDNGTLSSLTAQTVNGVATTSLSGATIAGTATVTATTGNQVSGNVPVVITPGPCALIDMVAAAETMFADNSSETTIAATCTDTYGNFVAAGTPVSFACVSGSVTTASTVGEDGQAAAVYRSGLDSGPVSITATNNSVIGSVTILLEATTPAAMTFNADPLQLVANGVSTSDLRALILDAESRPVSNGTSVTFTSQSGQIAGASATSSTQLLPGAAASPWATQLGRPQAGALVNTSDGPRRVGSGDPTTSTFTTTTMDGYAYATVTSPTTAGHDSLVATCGTLARERVLDYLAGDAAAIQVTPTMGEIPADGVSSTAVLCRVVDAFGNAVGAGVEVSCTATIGAVVPESGYTNDSGIFTTNLISTRDRGLSAVVANAGIASGYGEVRFVAPQVASVTLAATANPLFADGVSTSELTCTVADDYGLPVSGALVEWQAQPGIGSLQPLTTITNEAGEATARFQSGPAENDANQVISCSSGEHESQLTMQMTGVTITSWMDLTELPADGNATTSVNALLRETTSGVAISNALVWFAASSGAVTQSALTSTSGIATAEYRAGNDPAAVTITCTYGNALRTTTGLTLTDTEASVLLVQLGTNSILANGISTVPVSARVTNEAGQPVPNTPVTFSVNGPGVFLTPTVMSNDTGWAFATYRSVASGSDMQAELAVAIERTDEATTIELRGVTVEVSSDDAALPANGQSNTMVRCQVRETTSMQAVAGQSVAFATSLGSIPVSSTTNAAGVAQASLLASTEPGMAQVTATYGDALSTSMNIQMYPAVPAVVQINSEYNSVRADGMTTLEISAQVYDALGYALSNAPVSWTVTSGSLSNVETMTDGAGRATAMFTAAASVQDIAANVVATSVEAQSTFVIAQRGVTVTVTATPGTVIADGSSTSAIRAHVFETASNFAIAGVEVRFGATLGSMAGTALTNESGIATSNLTSATETGTSTVTASFGNTLTDQAQVTFAPSTPTTLTLTATPTVMLADNNSTSTLTAVVTDQNGNPVPNGTQVRYSLPPQSGSLENLRTTMGGVALNTLTSSTTPGSVLILAWAEADPNVRDSVEVTYIVGPPAVVTLTAQSDTLAADGIAVDTITAYVTDAVGHALPNVEVRFSTTIGSIATSRSTDGTGHASVAFSSPQTGTATISAMADSIYAAHTVYLIPGGPNSIQLAYNPGSVGVRGSGRNETLLVTATVRDVNNNTVIDGTPVYFNINNSPGGGDFLSSNGPIPTINGNATVSYNSGTVSGSARIRALCASISAVSTEILIFAGPPYIEDIADGCNTTHMSLASSPCSMFGMDVVGDSVQVMALVGDRYNNPVTPGTAVYFTTSGGVITTATGYTDSMGFARVTLWSGNPLPTIPRWLNTLSDPNIGGAILCSSIPDQHGLAKVLASSAGVDGNGDSVTVWASTNVVFEYSQPLLYLRDASVGGDPNEREIYIGENALVTIATYDPDYWPLVAGSTIRFSASEGRCYPAEITVGCPGDTSYTISFFNDLTLEDTDAATPVLIEVDTRQGDAYAFTETFTLRALLPQP